LAVAFGMIFATSPLVAASQEPIPMAAPAGNPDARYCLQVEPVTGTNVETVQCWTRDQWAEQGVDVDKEWAKEGVKTIG
jgi:hypothetical protein